MGKWTLTKKEKCGIMELKENYFMTRFQFILIMRTLLTILDLKLNDRSAKTWERAEREYNDIKSMYSLWQSTERDKF